VACCDDAAMPSLIRAADGSVQEIGDGRISYSATVDTSVEDGTLMSLKDKLKPHDNRRVMDLVAEAGVDVARWAQSKKGRPIQTPAANPAHVYEWAFVEPDKVVVLNLWYDEIEEQDGQLTRDLNLREWSEARQQSTTLKPGQRLASSRRASSMDRAIAYAYDNHLPVRVIIGDGPRRDYSDPKSQMPSRMLRRKLDEQTWFVQRYDHGTGNCRLHRGATPRFTDQFSTGQDHLPKQREVTGKAWERDYKVRVAVLGRAQGICEFCGKSGFMTAGGEVYLETHHVIPLSEGGGDHEGNVVAICPNDHREAHHGERRDAIRDRLLAMLCEMYDE
jgi:5-methylcytosine-specific restriction enzyme A